MPGEVGWASDTRSRLLCVQELLRCAIDKNHGLTTSEIVIILSFRASDDKVVSEPAVLEDIHAIKKNSPLEMEIDVPTRGKTGGFRCLKALLSDVEIRMLQNVVRASKFITSKQSRSLSNSLDGLLSSYDQDKITKSVFVDRRKRGSDPDVLRVCRQLSKRGRRKLLIC